MCDPAPVGDSAPPLVLLISGSGPHRSGVWDLDACLTGDILAASQLLWVDGVLRKGWEVMVLNPNQPHAFRGPVSSRAVRNVPFCWEEFVEGRGRSAHSDVYVIAHGTGAQRAVDLLEEYDAARERVRKVAFLNGVFRMASEDVSRILSERGRNWVPCSLPLDEEPPYHPVKLVMTCASASCTDPALMGGVCLDSVLRFLGEPK